MVVPQSLNCYIGQVKCSLVYDCGGCLGSEYEYAL